MDLNLLRKWEAEAAVITKSLGLVYSERNPPPEGKKFGDPLPASNNAITHAYVSAKITEYFGYPIARTLGDRREINQPPGPGEEWDTYKDMWNNEVGRRIGQKGGDVEGMIKDAMRNGDLIVVQTDTRIPPGWTYSKENVQSFNPAIPWWGPSSQYVPPPRCFAAGTPILMADGTEKPIQEVGAGDMVMSFDPTANGGLGAMVPQMVTRTFVNTTRVFIDLYGLKVTPGHEFLSDQGEWMLVADILRRDRAIVRSDENGLGVPYRARTNQPLKSFGDAVFKTRFIDPRTGAERYAEVRGGIPFEKVYSVMSGIQVRRNASLLEVLHFDKRISVRAFAENGRLCDNEDKPVGVLDWPAGTTPFDHDGAENHIVTLDGVPFIPDWILRIPRDGEEMKAVMNAGGGANDCILLSPEGVKTMRFEEGKGIFNEPAPRQALPPQRPTMVASNPTLPRQTNRAQRRKQAALHRVH